MSEELKSPETKNDWLKVAVIMFIVISLGISSLYFIGYNAKNDIDYLKEKISEKQNVTNDYRQGWNDAIAALEDFRLNVGVTNATK